MTTYKFGDYVEVTSTESRMYGRKGIVLARGTNNADDYFVAFDDNTMNWFNTSVLSSTTPTEDGSQRVKQIALQLQYINGKTQTEQLNDILDTNPNLRVTHMNIAGPTLYVLLEGKEGY